MILAHLSPQTPRYFLFLGLHHEAPSLVLPLTLTFPSMSSSDILWGEKLTKLLPGESMSNFPRILVVQRSRERACARNLQSLILWYAIIHILPPTNISRSKGKSNCDLISLKALLRPRARHLAVKLCQSELQPESTWMLLMSACEGGIWRYQGTGIPHLWKLFRVKIFLQQRML